MADHDSGAKGDGAGLFRREPRGRLPLLDDSREEPRAGARVLGEQFAGAVAVVADSRRVDERGRRLPRRAHGIGQSARRGDSRVEDLVAVALGPRDARERRSGEVHDGVDALHHGEVDDSRRRGPRPSSGECARRRTSRTISCPAAVRRSTSSAPMNPDAPATSTLMGQASSASIVIGIESAFEMGQLTFALPRTPRTPLR